MADITTQMSGGGAAVRHAGDPEASGPEARRPDPAPVLTAPPRQHPYDQALQLGFDALRSRPPSPGKLAALGVTAQDGTIRVPVLNRILCVDLEQGQVRVDASGPARSAWAVLTVHYLCAPDFTPDPRPVSFSYFQDCRSYLSVFGKRITQRFLATAGRNADQFVRLGAQLGGTPLHGWRTGFRFDIFPRVPITLVRYEGDDEMPPGASVVYCADAELLLPAEDRVVAAELLLDQLAGKPMSESGGSHA